MNAVFLMKRLITAGIIGLPLLGAGSLTWAQDAALKAEVEALKARLKTLEGQIAKEEQGEKAVPPKLSAQAQPVDWPVGGIYTNPATKDLGELTGLSALSGTKVRGWIDTHYVYNFNSPDRNTVNANQAASVVKGRNVSIEGRTFDIHDNSFSLSLAEVEIEKVPESGGVGFKFDLAVGETQDIIVDTIRGSLGPGAAGDSVTSFDKTFQHASVSYVAPIGNGLRFDAGKFVTHIGGETIETVKNWNYSHSFFYTYAIPFQDTGVRVNYPVTDTLYAELYVLNGWNVTIDNNKAKTLGPSIGWTPSPWLSVYANYLVGPERNDENNDLRHLFDTQLFFGPFDRWNFMVNFDYGKEENAVGPGIEDASWYGVAAYARYKWSDLFEPSVRLEYYKDPDGFTTGVMQKLWGATLTLNTKIGASKSKGSMLLLRPELRYDKSDVNFFTEKTNFRSRDDQWTLGVGLAWLF